MPKRVVVLSITVLALAAGCSKGYVYDKPNTLPAKSDADMADCRREARVYTGVSTLLNPQRIDQERFNRCMERRGYTVRRAD